MTITRMIPAELAGHGQIGAKLTWSPEVPVQVSAEFTTHQGMVPWCWSLDTMRIGAVSVFPSLVGRGDVKIGTDASTDVDPKAVVIYLQSPEGTATVSLDFPAVREFLDAVTLANLHEAEAMDALVEACLAELAQESF